MQNQWNERYARQEYIYGTEPNSFLKEKLSELKPGRILLPAEGEGRNAVYAATLGWQAEAFDQSEEAKRKALKLAEHNNVQIVYSIQSLDDWNPEPDQYDCIKALKPGGIIILEAFTVNQLSRSTGGPKAPELLFTSDQIKSDFGSLSEPQILEIQAILDEGPLHQGVADVVRLTGYKPSE